MSTLLVSMSVVCLAAGPIADLSSQVQERQVTLEPHNHMLDNNDNFSPDNEYLCYDTRETVGPGIENSQAIEKVEIESGEETVLLEATKSIIGVQAAPGIGAVSYNPSANHVVFIHGPLLEEVPVRGFYGKPNRRGGSVPDDGSRKLTWVDYRDVATERDTLPGAHRGGTHRHEFTHDGSRIGFTYDDFLMPEYGRTVGFMMPHADAPGDATHYFALLVRPVPMGTAKPGEIEDARHDSWIGREGLMRAFVGKVRNDDGETYEESLFVIDVPANIDITTADSGSADRYPTPPEGLTIRRLTHDWATGVVRGTLEGDRIAYYAKDVNDLDQIFIIPSDGSDQSDNPAKRPVQATDLPDGAGPGLRWHPSGNSVACMSDNGIVVTCVKPGSLFGKSAWLTTHGEKPVRDQLAWSYDGKTMAYCRPVRYKDAQGEGVTMYNGADPTQIFVIEFPDANGDGIVDGLE